MNDHWSSYVGMATGIIGAITGIAGSILGYVGYKRSENVKTLDKRLDHHKLRNEAHVASVQLTDLLIEAVNSKKAVMSATSGLNSEAMKAFIDKYTSDSEHALTLAEKIPKPDVDFESLTLEEINKEIVELHRVLGWINDMSNNYRKSLENDNSLRTEIRRRHEGV